MAKSGSTDPDEEEIGATGYSQNETSSESENQDSEEPILIVTKPSPATTNVSILIESLVQDLCSLYEPDHDNAQKIYNLICEKLFEMNMVDESYKMREFESMRDQYKRAFHKLVTTARGGEQPHPLRPSFSYQEITKESSHYYREFDEMEYIAGGGFGQVFRVKHKLDGTEYAVKKIVIRSEGIRSVMNYLSEVKTFASLNHSNIVQYKAAWLELGAPFSKIVDPKDIESEYSYIVETPEKSLKKSTQHGAQIFPDYVSEIESKIYQSTSENVSTDFEVSFLSSSDVKSKHHSLIRNSSTTSEWSVKRSRTKRSSTSEGGNAICTIDEIKSLQIQARPPSKWATLYIQMSLCQMTLKQWLETRNSAESAKGVLVPLNFNITRKSREETILEILKQILKGLEYIHSKQVVHHDIKPSNIFMEINANGSFLIQVGDFGLACPLQSAKHSLAFGTKTYAAPEQLQGKCDPKSDMYSLGIILFELVSQFTTDMERAESIELLRNACYKGLEEKHPFFAPIITSLMKKCPSERPDAKTLIERVFSNDEYSDEVRELRNQLLAQDEEIKRLKEILKHNGLEI